MSTGTVVRRPLALLRQKKIILFYVKTILSRVSGFNDSPVAHDIFFNFILNR